MASVGTELGHSNPTITPWTSFADESERAPELSWPTSIDTFDTMRTDMQVGAVLLAGTLPIRRRRWLIDQEGASDATTEYIANEMGLPVRGRDPEPLARTRNRFSHDFHLRHALLSLIYGHMFFEQVYEYGDDGLLHLRKLGPRMPRTISEIAIETDGGLSYIRQYSAGGGTRYGAGSPITVAGPPRIPVDRLVAYVNDREGSNWRGRSMLRPAYKHWLLKDRLLRVDALKHERNGLGVPMINAPEGATQAMIAKLDQLAQAYKAGDASGGALPYGAILKLVGVDGSLPDTLASIRYHDEQIARMMLADFMNLPSSSTGNRALGETLMEFFVSGQDALAKTYADVTTEHVIEDLVDLNWGSNEPAPRLVSEIDEDERLAVSDLCLLVDKGLIVVDEELEEYVRSTYNLPESNATVIPLRPANEPAAASSKHSDRPTMKAVAGNRELRRDLYDHEIRAAFDPESLEQGHMSATEELVVSWGTVKQQQVDELVAQIEEANGDLETLAAIAATAVGADLLTSRLLSSAQDAAEAAKGELSVQGVEVGDTEVLEEDVSDRARAIDAVMARSISEAASRKALEETGPSTEAIVVADRVRSHLNGLSDAYLRDQLGGAITTAQNVGRFKVFEKAPIRNAYASELLDPRRICGKCIEIDGKEYDSVEAARVDYPTGRYRDCKGGVRCRGTIVVVASDEEEATEEGWSLFG